MQGVEGFIILTTGRRFLHGSWKDNMENFNPFSENGEQGTGRGRDQHCLHCHIVEQRLVQERRNMLQEKAYVHNSSSLHMTASFFSLLDSFHFCPLGFKSAYPSIFFSFFNHIGLPDLGNTTSSLLSTCCHVVLELWYNWSWVKATWSLEVES
uniref:Uncharacterized protein n=1 Tax=Zea mays TaxID=4577 RepID=A0A804UAC4_MAIZE